MTKSQQAMAVAMVYPEPERGKRNDLLNNSTSLAFDKSYLSKARTVLRDFPIKAAEVLAGTTSVTEAFEDAKSETSKSDGKEARLVKLQESDLDLAELVLKGTLSTVLDVIWGMSD